jgi:hypothetical protein
MLNLTAANRQGQAQCQILSRPWRVPEAFIAIQPAEMFDVFRAFRGEGGIERNFFAAYAATGGSCKVSDEAAFCLQRPNISKTLEPGSLAPCITLPQMREAFRARITQFPDGA